MMTSTPSHFAQGNVRKLLAAPLYALGAVCHLCVVRSTRIWVFGSASGVAEGPRAVARQLRDEHTGDRIFWCVTNNEDAELASSEGFTPVIRDSWAGFWATLRARHIVVSHGVGDVNRFGVFGSHLTLLIHGSPIKKMHLDSPATTRVSAPAPVRSLLRAMYLKASRQISLMTAGSPTAAARLRSAYRLEAGKVKVLGDPRIDELCRHAAEPKVQHEVRGFIARLCNLDEGAPDRSRFILYAPTWRDGESDPGVPSSAECELITESLEKHDAYLVLRPHPLGAGAYESVLSKRIVYLGANACRDINVVLSGFDALITDYSSIAIDFSLFSRPIIWFAPDAEHYANTRGLYEPLVITAAGQLHSSWAEVVSVLNNVLQHAQARDAAVRQANALRERFISFTDGESAERVLAAIRSADDEIVVPKNAVFFESFYGRGVTCNPLAIDRYIAQHKPTVSRYWSVADESVGAPSGAIALVVGSRAWHEVRSQAQLLVVNDWLRFGFRRRRHQTVLQTWHGTMLKHLALTRPRVGMRTRMAIHRESRRWSLMLSQNAHATRHFRRSYAFRGEILELGYPRNDPLANAVHSGDKIDIVRMNARSMLGIPQSARVLLYAPTWRDGGSKSHQLDVHELARQLPSDFIVLVRSHTRDLTRVHAGNQRVIDVSHYDDVNDLIIAADLFVTDYSSLMFDVPVAWVPMAFFVPDLTHYRDTERGFTFDFTQTSPGPMCETLEQLVSYVNSGDYLEQPRSTEYQSWRERFAPHDDGSATQRVVEALVARGLLIE